MKLGRGKREKIREKRAKPTSFAVATLEPGRTAAHAGRRAAAAVHALRVAQRGAAVLAHVALGTLADLVVVAPAAVGALFVALGVGPTCTSATPSSRQPSRTAQTKHTNFVHTRPLRLSLSAGFSSGAEGAGRSHQLVRRHKRAFFFLIFSAKRTIETCPE